MFFIEAANLSFWLICVPCTLYLNDMNDETALLGGKNNKLYLSMQKYASFATSFLSYEIHCTCPKHFFEDSLSTTRV